MTDVPYITEADKQEYQRFVRHHLAGFARPPSKELWHYTTAEGLIAILSTGRMFTTQVTCLNDSLEQRYFGDLVHDGVKALIASNKNSTFQVMLRAADVALSNRDFSSAWHFVACFSEVEDDLGQWRGYGGGQCGYAIGFDSDSLFKAVALRRPGSLVLPMNYDSTKHKFLVDEVLQNAEQYFLAGAKKFPETERWANEFLAAFSWEMDIYACMIKHPKFASESERRIVTGFRADETSILEFRQRQTLLARHLPIDLRSPTDLLPITRIYVGPGSAQRVSQVSVGDLLVKCGYKGIPVEKSSVPYRVP